MHFIRDSYLIEGAEIYFAKFKLTSVLIKNRDYSILVIIDSIISGEISEYYEDEEIVSRTFIMFEILHELYHMMLKDVLPDK